MASTVAWVDGRSSMPLRLETSPWAGVMPMQIHKNHRGRQSESHAGSHDWRGPGSDFVLVEERQPPPRIELARERMLMCRLYIGLIRTLNEDYGAAFGSPSHGATGRKMGLYDVLCPMMGTPGTASRSAR